MPCHTRPFILPGIVVERRDTADVPPAAERCDYCGSERIAWRKCKLVCIDCKQINKSCADL